LAIVNAKSFGEKFQLAVEKYQVAMEKFHHSAEMYHLF